GVGVEGRGGGGGAGGVGVGGRLAAAVIAVMLASGRALESWAAGRARRDLNGLLARAPRTARRYCGTALATVELSEVVPGDRLLVARSGPTPPERSGHCAWAGSAAWSWPRAPEPTPPTGSAS